MKDGGWMEERGRRDGGGWREERGGREKGGIDELGDPLGVSRGAIFEPKGNCESKGTRQYVLRCLSDFGQQGISSGFSGSGGCLGSRWGPLGLSWDSLGALLGHLGTLRAI